MRKELENLLKMMDAEMFYEGAEIVYEQIYRSPRGLRRRDPGYPDMIKAEFAKLLETRELSTVDYCRLTAIDFNDQDSLYQHLGRVYRYLFEGADQDAPPHPPGDTV